MMKVFDRKLPSVEGEGRRLGYWETLNALVHEVHGHGTLACLMSVAGLVDPEHLRLAMEVLFIRHPLLRSILRTDADGFYIVAPAADFANIDLKVIEGDRVAAEEEYQAQSYEPFDFSRAVWRMSLVLDRSKDRSVLVGAFSHAVGDGVSLANAMGELVRYINALARGEAHVLPESLPFVKPVEAVVDKTRFIAEAKEVLASGEATMEAGSKRAAWKFHVADPGLEARRTGHVFYEMLSESYDALLIACKANGVTVNAFLNASLLLSLKSIRDDVDILCTSLCTPISLRSYTKPEVPDDYFGCYVTMVLTEHKIKGDEDVWALASSYHDAVRVAISDAGNYPEAYSLSDITPYRDQCLARRNAFCMDFGITNLGKIRCFDDVGEQRYSVEDFYFCASRQAADFAGLLCVSSFKGKMFIDFSYTAPVFSRECMQNIQRHFSGLVSNCRKQVNREY